MCRLIVLLALVSPACSLLDQGEIINLGSPMEARAWVAQHVRYVSDGATDRWQFPSETYRTRQGDCEDFALLLASALIAAGDETAGVVIVDSLGPSAHTVTQSADGLIEPQSGHEFREGWPVIERYDFYAALFWCQR